MASPSITSSIGQKIASVFLRNTPSAPSLSSINSPFSFTRLPYDIRIIIYSCVNTRPPLAPRTDTLGLYLSCHQVKSELDELTRKEVSGLCTNIERTSNVDMAIELDLDEYRNVKVTLPYTLFGTGDQTFRCPKWSRDTMSALHPLFALHLDILHIHISSHGCAQQNLPRHDTLREKLDLQDTMRNLLRGIVSVIDYQNVYILHADVAATDEQGLEKVFQRNTEESLAPYPVAPIRTKHICLSWDLRTVPDGPTNLVGRRFERLDTPTDAEISAARSGWKKKFVKDDGSKAGHRVFATGYYLRDADHLVGEVGIISPSRWVLSEPIWLHVTSLVDNVRRIGCVISSKGLGRKYDIGRGVVRKKDFEEVERIVGAERARMQEERKVDELWMAYAMEGVTID